MVLAIQAAGLAFLVAMSYMTFYYYKRNSYSLNSLIAWQIVWILAAVLLFTPGFFDRLLGHLDITRVTDLYVFIAIAFFGFISFLTYIKVQRQEQKLEEVVREMAKSR